MTGRVCFCVGERHREKEEGCRQRERERESERTPAVSQISAVARTPRRSAFLRQQDEEKAAR